jgi:hypothetical protein
MPQITQMGPKGQKGQKGHKGRKVQSADGADGRDGSDQSAALASPGFTLIDNFMIYHGEDFTLIGKKRKTYGRLFVRFFRIKMHFAPFFGASAKMPFPTCTESIIYIRAKNAPFI